MADDEAPDPRRSVPRTDTVLADPRLRPPPRRLGPDARAPRRGRRAGPRPRRRAGPRRRRRRRARRAAGRAPPPCARCSTRPASCCTPTSAGRRCRPPPSRRSSRRPAPSTSSSTSPPGGAGRRGAGPRRRAARSRARGRGRPRRQQRRRRARARHDGAGRRPRGGRQPRRDGRDRRRLPAARPDRLVRRPAARGRHDEPHPPARLRRRGRARHRRVLKVHPSNFAVEGFTSAVSGQRAREARRARSCTTSAAGCCARDPLLPDEPDATTSLRDGAAVVTCSGDKLLGGPQAGLVLGRARRRRAAAPPPPRPRAAGRQDHPRGPRGDPARPRPPAVAALELGAAALKRRCDAVATHLAAPDPGRGRALARPGRRRLGARRCPAGLGRGAARGLGRAAAARRPRRRSRGCERGRMPGRPARPRPAPRRRAGRRRASRGTGRRRGRPDRRADVAVVATAGHVDHGKSALVRAITGTDPDRLPEERRRGMTIELGHVWADVDGRRVAVVDVPGHDRFVGTTLAGLGPVAGVLLVVAADEGWRAADRGARGGRAARWGSPTSRSS